MTKRIVTAVVAALALTAGLFLTAGAGLAQTQTQKSPKAEKAKEASAQMIKGTITDWNDTAKSFRVKTDGGQEMTFTWDDATQVHGTGRVGEMVKVQTKKGQDKVAAQIFVGAEGSGQPEKGKKPNG